MRITSEGRDDFGVLKVVMPERCEVCATDQDVVVVYDTASIKRTFKLFKIDLEKTIIGDQQGNRFTRIRKIGVTCGCYSKFHRQVAHIKDKMVTKGKKRYEEEPRAKLSREG